MTYELDARNMGRRRVHDYLIDHLPLPDYYGRNLDALYDVLTEMEDVTLRISHADQAPVSFASVRRVLTDAAADNPDLTVEFVEEDSVSEP